MWGRPPRGWGLTTPTRIPVVVDAPQHSGLDRALDYLSEASPPPGSLLRVPLGRREVLGIVWQRDGAEAAPLPDDALRTAGPAFDALPPLPEAWRKLVDFAAAYYQRSVGELALSVLPPELRKLDGPAIAKRQARLAKRLARGGAELAGAPPVLRPDLA